MNDFFRKLIKVLNVFITQGRGVNIKFLFGFLFFLACSKPIAKEDASDALFKKGESLGKLDHRLVEASGLVASVNNPGYLWSHNDGENPAEVFLIDQDADIKLVCKFKHIRNRDWEDIAVGRGSEVGKTYVYVGDIGDNKALFPVKLIYRFQEPLLSKEEEIVISDYDTLVVKLPDGVRDSEALTIDPLSGDMFLFSKREDSIRVYQMHYPFDQDTLLPERIAILPFHNINAADISMDGSEVLIKDYDNIYYWRREGDELIDDLLKKRPIELPYDKGPQDEAIAWALDGSGFYVVGETVGGEKGKLVFHKRK
ncbi:MAG: hypothetical protein JJE09_10970 [Bacteroidia bacterium]|nr:hypothetical protein [Bacteroidia bacterium]